MGGGSWRWFWPVRRSPAPGGKKGDAGVVAGDSLDLSNAVPAPGGMEKRKDATMKKLLIITYDFPPSLAGVRRVLKWIRYLPEFGWECSVMTVKNVRSIHRDSSPISWLSEHGVPIYRTGSLDPYRLAEIFSLARHSTKENITHASGVSKSLMEFLRRWIFIPDDRCGWIPFATLKGLSLIRKIRPDAILTTSYPHSAHIVGLKLKILTGVPWVADFRDAWTRNPVFFHPPTPVHKGLHCFLEKWVAARADLLLSVSDPITGHFRALVPRNASRMHTLTNGYDEEEYANLKSHPPQNFRLVYTGTLYGQRTPLPFFQAVDEILKDHPEWRPDFEIRFYAALENSLLSFIREKNLDDIIHVKGLCPYPEGLQHQMDATALLHFIGPEPNADVMMTQKVFEYLRSGRPILAMIPEGACRKMMESLGESRIIHPTDVAGIKRHLKELYEEWKAGLLVARTRAGLEFFERRHLTRRLASLLDHLIKRDQR